MNSAISRETIARTFGFTAGIVFSIAVFGVNAVFQTINHLYLSGMTFLISLVIFTGLTYISSLHTIKTQSALSGGLVWTGSGLIIGLLTVLLPMYLYPKVVFLTVPEAAGWFKYDWNSDQLFVLFFSTAICAVSFLMIGLIENNLADSAYFSNTLGVLLFNALIIALFTFVIGSVIDTMVNGKAREAANGLNYIIEYSRTHDPESIPKETRRNLRLAALSSIQDTLDEDYTLYIFEQNMGYESTNFLYRVDSLWANCYVFGDNPSNCFVVEPK